MPKNRKQQAKQGFRRNPYVLRGRVNTSLLYQFNLKVSGWPTQEAAVMLSGFLLGAESGQDGAWLPAKRGTGSQRQRGQVGWALVTRASDVQGATWQCRIQTVATWQEEGILDHGLIYSLSILLFQSLSKCSASILLKCIIFMNTCFCLLRLVTFIYLEHITHVLLKHKSQSLAHSSPPPVI